MEVTLCNKERKIEEAVPISKPTKRDKTANFKVFFI
jgi:hypothetical protein